MLRKLILIASALALATGPVLADHHEGEPPPPPPGDMPQLVLMPPPDTVPPEDAGEPPPEDPEAAKDWLTGIFFPMMDTDDDDMLSQAELRAWVAFAHIPFMPPDDGPPPDGEPMGDEEWEQVACGEAVGNQVIREISITPGPANVAISLPPGRNAGCFHLAVTGADIETLVNEFQIVQETDPPTTPLPVVWNSLADGQAAYEALVLTEGIYQVELITSGVPEAVFTITFVDYPVGP